MLELAGMCFCFASSLHCLNAISLLLGSLSPGFLVSSSPSTLWRTLCFCHCVFWLQLLYRVIDTWWITGFQQQQQLLLLLLPRIYLALQILDKMMMMMMIPSNQIMQLQLDLQGFVFLILHASFLTDSMQLLLMGGFFFLLFFAQVD